MRYYDDRRSHQRMGQRCPEGSFESANAGMIYRRAVRGGLMNDYYRNIA